ncbi:inosine monophosphate dehydrogenase [Delitschia confertaspora ATCC 74209]|uniref:Inosine monophosphate dehydrogenase n=1 Tax=Delitschia confertaspora ATCC 74209 TaxID=1513339 RepID=A0A9P4JFD0_9PLEO|nr:inosine monophosphate dehydrogenase [Delitschia confertaspora ATCC 74209]
MDATERLKKDYPWIQTPLIVQAPMRLISLAPLAVEVWKAGGIGFIGAGTDVSTLSSDLSTAQSLLQSSPTSSTTAHTLPIGIGVICWGASLSEALPSIQSYRPAALWLFAAKSISEFSTWATEIRRVSPQTKIWVQVGSVKEAVSITKAVKPDILVIQGTDAGGHGLVNGASIISLVPEVHDAVQELVEKERVPEPVIIAAGSIVEGRGAAAALALGAAGVAMGTRFLASHEASISKGYQNEVLRASDGGQTTVRTKVYDTLRGTTGWADTHNARGIINRSYGDAMSGMTEEENRRLYEEEVGKGDGGWGVEGRMTTYAGVGVGLIKEVKNAKEIVEEVRDAARRVVERLKLERLDEKGSKVKL